MVSLTANNVIYRFSATGNWGNIKRQFTIMTKETQRRLPVTSAAKLRRSIILPHTGVHTFWSCMEILSVPVDKSSAEKSSFTSTSMKRGLVARITA